LGRSSAIEDLLLSIGALRLSMPKGDLSGPRARSDYKANPHKKKNPKPQH